MGAPAIGFVDMVANTPLAAATLFAVALHFALVGVCAYVCMRVCVCVCVFVCVSDLKCLLPLLNAASSLVFLQSGRSDARHWNTESIVLCVLSERTRVCLVIARIMPVWGGSDSTRSRTLCSKITLYSILTRRCGGYDDT